jgi:hypothetical protein
MTQQYKEMFQQNHMHPPEQPHHKLKVCLVEELERIEWLHFNFLHVWFSTISNKIRVERLLDLYMEIYYK